MLHASEMRVRIPCGVLSATARATASPLNGVLRLEVALLLPPDVHGRGAVVGLW